MVALRNVPFPIIIASMAFICGIMAVSPLLMQLGDAQADYGQKTTDIPGAKTFVAPSGFPKNIFPSYYPTPTGQQPQPKM